MKKLLVISLMSIMATFFVACGGSDEVAVEPSGSAWPLIEDDGQGVIFTSYDESGKVASQIKFYDNQLRKILNDETFNGSGTVSTYELGHAQARIYLFGLEYGDTTIEQVTCDLEKGSNETLQLAFACYVDPSDPDALVETYETGLLSCPGGIPWQKLIHMAHVPMNENKTLYCTGGNKTFYIDIFKEIGISTNEFTMFFDFIAKTFRGKMVITEVGQEAGDASTVLVFKGLE